MQDKQIVHDWFRWVCNLRAFSPRHVSAMTINDVIQGLRHECGIDGDLSPLYQGMYIAYVTAPESVEKRAFSEYYNPQGRKVKAIAIDLGLSRMGLHKAVTRFTDRLLTSGSRVAKSLC